MTYIEKYIKKDTSKLTEKQLSLLETCIQRQFIEILNWIKKGRDIDYITSYYDNCSVAGWVIKESQTAYSSPYSALRSLEKKCFLTIPRGGGHYFSIVFSKEIKEHIIKTIQEGKYL